MRFSQIIDFFFHYFNFFFYFLKLIFQFLEIFFSLGKILKILKKIRKNVKFSMGFSKNFLVLKKFSIFFQIFCKKKQRYSENSGKNMEEFRNSKDQEKCFLIQKKFSKKIFQFYFMKIRKILKKNLEKNSEIHRIKEKIF